MSKRCLALLFLTVAPGIVLADGLAVDKVYHPYVQPLEREFEYRSSWLEDDDRQLDGLQSHRLGYGASLSDRWFAEFYVIGSKEKGHSLSLDAYEAELKWQLTEQGEYAVDWGLLFELEIERQNNVREYSTTLLMEKEFGRWAGTLNISAIYEWGSDIRNEWETAAAGQLRYRYTRGFEPALEVYSSELTKGMGPVALGTVPFSGARKLHWEAGLIFAMDSDSPDKTLRLSLEYEF